jgi:hypothetical protein
MTLPRGVYDDVFGTKSYRRGSDLEVLLDLVVNPESIDGSIQEALATDGPVIIHPGMCQSPSPSMLQQRCEELERLLSEERAKTRSTPPSARRLGELEAERDEWRRKAEINEGAAEFLDVIKYVIPGSLVEDAGFEVVQVSPTQTKLRRKLTSRVRGPAAKRPLLKGEMVPVDAVTAPPAKPVDPSDDPNDPSRTEKLQPGDLVRVRSGGGEGTVIKYVQRRGWLLRMTEKKNTAYFNRDRLAFIRRGEVLPPPSRFDDLDLGDE